MAITIRSTLHRWAVGGKRPFAFGIALVITSTLLTSALCGREPEIPDALLDVVTGQVEVISGPELALTVVNDESELSAGDRIRVLEGALEGRVETGHNRC